MHSNELDIGASSAPAVCAETPSRTARRAHHDEHHSDSEDDHWQPTSRRKTPHSSRRRIAASSDEESPAAGRALASSPTARQPGKTIIDLTGSPDTSLSSGHRSPSSVVSDSNADSLLDAGRAHRPISIASSSTSSARSRSALVLAESDDEDEDTRLARRLKKHYDTSAGSLEDFIVNDSDEFTDPELVERPGRRVWSEAEESDGFHDGDDEEISSSDEEYRRVWAGKGKGRRKAFAGAEDIDDIPDLGSLTIKDKAEEREKVQREQSIIKSTDMTKKEWAKMRERITDGLMDDMDRLVFPSALKQQTEVVWNGGLRSSAGQATLVK